MLIYKILIGNEVKPLIKLISKIRVEEFRKFPYLYVGNRDYEEKYLEGFFNETRSCLAIAMKSNDIIGICTSMPLQCESDILKDVEILFNGQGLKIENFFYFGEFIVVPDQRGKGISVNMEKLTLEHAKSWGYTNACLAVVSRSDEDPRRPKNYISNDSVWSKMGYRKMNLSIQYNWPTILTTGKVEDEANKLEFWQKEIP